MRRTSRTQVSTASAESTPTATQVRGHEVCQTARTRSEKNVTAAKAEEHDLGTIRRPEPSYLSAPHLERAARFGGSRPTDWVHRLQSRGRLVHVIDIRDSGTALVEESETERTQQLFHSGGLT
jgi:hypothetical protein